MKTSVGVFYSVAAAVLCVGAFVSCSKEPEYNKSVDVSAQVQQLKSQDLQARQDACIKLAEAGPNAAKAVPDLTAVLEDQDPLLRRLAAYALGQIGPAAASAIPSLKELLGDPDMSTMLNAMNAIRAIDPKAMPGGKVENVTVPPSQ